MNAGKAIGGVFMEKGWGNYNSHNIFSTSKVRGDGNSDDYGLGILEKFTLNKDLYVEGSLRGGCSKADFHSVDMLMSVLYSSADAYYGGHVGIGCLWQISEQHQVDFYSKYLYTRQQRDSVTLITNKR